jgi:transcriptional regulator with XRE-family HTH domain
MIEINAAQDSGSGTRLMDESTQDQLFGTPIGERLRVAREDKGMSLEDVARQTRIPIRHLEHIERGEWDALPAITYSVGFARSYANVVGLDGPAIGAELREQLGGQPRGQTSVPAYYEPADPARVPPRSLAIMALLIGLLLVGGYLFWRSRAVDDPAVEETAIVDAPAAPRPAGPAPAAAPATGPVIVAAIQEVWLRIYEDDGPKLYEGTLRAGERYQVPANARAPQILTGRPNAIQVTVGSTAIPPLGQPERTIADVSLRPADLLARTQAAAPVAAPTPAPAPPPAR